MSRFTHEFIDYLTISKYARNIGFYITSKGFWEDVLLENVLKQYRFIA